MGAPDNCHVFRRHPRPQSGVWRLPPAALRLENASVCGSDRLHRRHHGSPERQNGRQAVRATGLQAPTNLDSCAGVRNRNGKRAVHVAPALVQLLDVPACCDPCGASVFTKGHRDLKLNEPTFSGYREGGSVARRWRHGMKYILLVHHSEEVLAKLNETERQKMLAESVQLANQLHDKGQYFDAAPLHPTATATSVKVRDGKRLVTDGPFAETREQVGGYFLINARDLEEAIAIAGRIPGARIGTVEVRQVKEVPGLP
jgi:hypothetical protein